MSPFEEDRLGGQDRSDRARRPGRLRRLVGGQHLLDLSRALSRRPSRNGLLEVRADGSFDLFATARACDLPVEELLGWLAVRQRTTARVAWATWALGGGFFVAWQWQALTFELTTFRLWTSLQFLPFVLLFFLLGVQSALTNFQIRMRRAASVREWLTTDHGFWPV